MKFRAPTRLLPPRLAVAESPLAFVKDAQQPAAAKKFLNYLDSTEAGDIFKKFGFTLRD